MKNNFQKDFCSRHENTVTDFLLEVGNRYVLWVWNLFCITVEVSCFETTIFRRVDLPPCQLPDEMGQRVSAWIVQFYC